MTGNDTSGADKIYAFVTFTLPQYVEALELRGSAVIDAFGNDAANWLAGNAGGNLLDGGAGADRMRGAGGNDTYIVASARHALGRWWTRQHRRRSGQQHTRTRRRSG